MFPLSTPTWVHGRGVIVERLNAVLQVPFVYFSHHRFSYFSARTSIQRGYCKQLTCVQAGDKDCQPVNGGYSGKAFHNFAIPVESKYITRIKWLPYFVCSWSTHRLSFSINCRTVYVRLFQTLAEGTGSRWQNFGCVVTANFSRIQGISKVFRHYIHSPSSQGWWLLRPWLIDRNVGFFSVWSIPSIHSLRSLIYKAERETYV